MDVKRSVLERNIPYAIEQLSKPGQFLSMSNYLEGPHKGILDGICGHDARAAREWLLHLIESKRPNYDPAMDWRHPERHHFRGSYRMGHTGSPIYCGDCDKPRADGMHF